MKVTVIKAAAERTKPSNYCPWFVDDPPAPKK
jgi:hypothetical protein